MVASPGPAGPWKAPVPISPLAERAWIAPVPAALTPLVGREREIAVACALLRRSDVRLLTLTGPGGIGKTRVAQQLAVELDPDFPDGVAWAALGAISEATAVLSAIAKTVGVGDASHLSLLDGLKTSL